MADLYDVAILFMQLNAYGGFLEYTVRYSFGDNSFPVDKQDIIVKVNKLTLLCHYAGIKWMN